MEQWMERFVLVGGGVLEQTNCLTNHSDLLLPRHFSEQLFLEPKPNLPVLPAQT